MVYLFNKDIRASLLESSELKNKLNFLNVGRLRFELRTSRLKAGCSTAELATHL